MTAKQIELFGIEQDNDKIKPVILKCPNYPVWTERKAKLIQRYLHLFVHITKHGTYIDGFAGPQNESDPESWAAKLALDFEPKWMRYFYLFDADRNQYECLLRLKDAQPENPIRELHVEYGDFNKLIHTFLRERPIGEREATFCLLDQRTFECDWLTVATIAQHKKSGFKIEFFYFLPNSWLDRAISALSTNKEIKLAAWWGRNDWDALLNSRGYNRAILFCNRFINELGYKYATPWAIYERQGGGRIMYFMIHATDHPVAPQLMRRAYESAVRPICEQEQMTLLF